MRKLERLKCSCGQRLGEKQGNWFVYANPLVCPQCGSDNSGNLKPHLIGANSELRQPQQPQPQPQSEPQTSTGQPQQPQNEAKSERVAATPLENPRHERFCQIFALRKCSATRAYIDAGFDTDSEGARRSASRLLTSVDVVTRINELQAELARKAVETEHWSREERIARLQRRAVELDEVIAARALETENWEAAGGHTGHIVRTFKAAGGMVVDEYAVDLGLLKELRAIEQQIAQELGEWLNKTALDFRSDIPAFEVPENASIEQIREAKRKLIEAMSAFKQPPEPQSVQ